MFKTLTSDEMNDAVDVACGREPRSVSGKAAEVKEEVKEVKKAAEKKAAPAKKESLKNFENRLNEYANYKTTVLSALMKNPPERCEASILDAMANRARFAAAREILEEIRKNPSQKTQILTKAQENFDTMMKNIREFLPKTIDPAEMKQAVDRGMLAGPLAQKMDYIGETALENYQNYLENGDNFKQLIFHAVSEFDALEAQGINPKKHYGEPLGMKKAAPESEPQKEPQIEEPVKAGPALG